MPDFKTVHGFYRYTDIWFEWYGWRLWEFRGRDVLTCRDCRNQVLPNKEDGFAVKAILAHDAITHPDHPLRIAGKQGIELFIGELAHILLPNGQSHTFLSGTLENGEARLLFSSAQVEYIRYWLHTMGFTKELIPLPYSDCLLTSSRLQNHSPVVYKTGTELRSALKVDNGFPGRMIRD
jgi:hypothetical protein